MRFEEALHNFQKAVMAEYGPGCEITKIGLSAPLFKQVVAGVKTTGRYTSYSRIDIGLEDIGELFCLGTQILKRDKDKF